MEEIQRLSKAILFAHAYIRHKGNGTQAALEVFDIRSNNPENTAHAIACEYLRKPTVQQVLRNFMVKDRSITAFIVSSLMQIIEDEECSHESRLKAIGMLARCAGYEVGESLYTLDKARIEAQARITMKQMQLEARKR